VREAIEVESHDVGTYKIDILPLQDDAVANRTESKHNTQLTPPTVSRWIADAETGPEHDKRRRKHAFRHHVSELLSTWNMEDAQLSGGDTLPDEVNVDLDVFRPPMVNRVAGHIHSRDIVTVCHSGLRDAAVELIEELS
jgi:hypothetical protein